jgi:hypothetical protein
MVWDGFLLSILLYNVVRSARRGGRAVGLELLAFSLTYAATFSLAPVLTSFVRTHAASPPPLLSVLSILLIYFAARRLLRVLFRPLLPIPAHESPWVVPQTRVSWISGAGFGVLRGAIVVVAIAIMGSCLARVQQAGLLHVLPHAESSVAVQRVGGLIDLVMFRYTRDAGPTTRLLLELSLHPDDARFSELLKGPFVERLKNSEEVHALSKDVEVRRLIQEKRAVEVLTHTAFLRVLSFALQELRNEQPGTLPI